MLVSGVQIREWPKPLGGVSQASLRHAWSSDDTGTAIDVTQSGTLIVWKHNMHDLTPPHMSLDLSSDEAASNATWDPDQAPSADGADSAVAAGSASVGSESGDSVPSQRDVWPVGLRLARCAFSVSTVLRSQGTSVSPLLLFNLRVCT